MMRIVGKFPLRMDESLSDVFIISMPEGAEVLTVQMQNELPQIWALIDTSRRYTNRRFRIAGTGHPIEEDINIIKYVGTFQMYEDSLVFHVFEIEL